MKSKLMAAAAVAALSCAGAAQAEPITFFGYIFNPSINAQVAPNYEGGKKYNVFPSGNLAISKPWEFDAFSAPDDAATFAVVNLKHIQFGPALSVRVNRGDSDTLAGMRNIGWSMEGGGFVNIWPTDHVRVHIEGLKGLTAQSGIVVNSGIDYVVHPKYWNLSIGPRYSWGDDHFNGTYFGVTPGEAAASPYIANPFHARAGSHFAGVTTMAEYKWRPRWRLTFNASYQRLLGDDANSPLVKQLGKADQLQAGAGIRFMLSDPTK